MIEEGGSRQGVDSELSGGVWEGGGEVRGCEMIRKSDAEFGSRPLLWFESAFWVTRLMGDSQGKGGKEWPYMLKYVEGGVKAERTLFPVFVCNI